MGTPDGGEFSGTDARVNGCSGSNRGSIRFDLSSHSSPSHTSRSAGLPIMARRCAGHGRDARAMCSFAVDPSGGAQNGGVCVAEVNAIPAALGVR
jgi:hypothetical protein